MVPACGSQTAAWKFVLPATLPEPDTTSTLLLFSKATWTGLIGMVYGMVLHIPVTLAWDHAGVKVSVRTSNTAHESVLQAEWRMKTSRRRSFVRDRKRRAAWKNEFKALHWELTTLDNSPHRRSRMYLQCEWLHTAASAGTAE